MKISEIFMASELLAKISSNKNLPTRVAYKLYMLLSSLDKELEFYDKKRREIFEEYGEANGEQITIPKEKVSLVEPLFAELNELTVENPPEKIDISLDVDLGVSASEIELLLPFVNFVE